MSVDEFIQFLMKQGLSDQDCQVVKGKVAVVDHNKIMRIDYT